MFDDPTLVGSWTILTERLEADGVLHRWAEHEPRLADARTISGLTTAWADPDRTHRIAASLIELAAIDGGADPDALLLLLHLLSGLVWRLSAQLADLSPDITRVVLSELTCQIRTYKWRVRPGGLVANLERETRRVVLAELRPSDRYHPDRVERLTSDGHLSDRHRLALADPGGEDDMELLDLLLWAVSAGVNEDDLRLLLESEYARGVRGARADGRVAAARGISRRTLLRRRERVLTALRAIAPAYLAATA
jgi:hypothetical protein